MEGERRLKIVLIVFATVVFALSYVVGYVVGKEAGFREAQKKFEVERQRLLKTLAQLNPVSRPIESKVLDETSEEKRVAETEEKAEEQKQTAEEAENHTVAQEQPDGKPPEEETGKGEIETVKPPGKREVITAEAGREEKKQTAQEEGIEEEGDYYLQVGVFRNRANALRFAEKLKELGFKVKTVFKGDLTYVIVGYYETLDEARTVKEELAEEKINSILKRRQD